MAVFYSHPFSYQAEEPLLNQSEDPREESPQKSLTIPQVFAVIGLRKPLMIVSLVMVTQQLSGKYFDFQFETDSLTNNSQESTQVKIFLLLQSRLNNFF